MSASLLLADATGAIYNSGGTRYRRGEGRVGGEGRGGKKGRRGEAE